MLRQSVYGPAWLRVALTALITAAAATIARAGTPTEPVMAWGYSATEAESASAPLAARSPRAARSATSVPLSVLDAIDFDGDGLADHIDNCPARGNGSQADADMDGLGDACDGCPFGVDDDADGICNATDNCPARFNPDQADLDRNAVGDVCDVQRCFADLSAEDLQLADWLARTDPRVFEELRDHRTRTLQAAAVCLDHGLDATRRVREMIYDYEDNQLHDVLANLDARSIELVRMRREHPVVSEPERDQALAIAGAHPEVVKRLPDLDLALTTVAVREGKTPGACKKHRCIDVIYDSSEDGGGTFTPPELYGDGATNWSAVQHEILIVIDMTTLRVIDVLDL